MQAYKLLSILVALFFLVSCDSKTSLRNIAVLDSLDSIQVNDHTEVVIDEHLVDTTPVLQASTTVETKDAKPDDIVEYALTLIGTPYKYGSIEKQQGFDCSGFITHVFNHFNIAVPRSSVDFTNVGHEIPISESKPGDLILFTGTDSTKRVVGHMGIIVTNSDTTRFVHSTSGRAYGVTVSPVNSSYRGRFVKTIRIFK